MSYMFVILPWFRRRGRWTTSQAEIFSLASVLITLLCLSTCGCKTKGDRSGKELQSPPSEMNTPSSARDMPCSDVKFRRHLEEISESLQYGQMPYPCSSPFSGSLIGSVAPDGAVAVAADVLVWTGLGHLRAEADQTLRAFLTRWLADPQNKKRARAVTMPVQLLGDCLSPSFSREMAVCCGSYSASRVRLIGGVIWQRPDISGLCLTLRFAPAPGGEAPAHRAGEFTPVLLVPKGKETQLTDRSCETVGRTSAADTSRLLRFLREFTYTNVDQMATIRKKVPRLNPDLFEKERFVPTPQVGEILLSKSISTGNSSAWFLGNYLAPSKYSGAEFCQIRFAIAVRAGHLQIIRADTFFGEDAIDWEPYCFLGKDPHGWTYLLVLSTQLDWSRFDLLTLRDTSLEFAGLVFQPDVAELFGDS